MSLAELSNLCDAAVPAVGTGSFHMPHLMTRVYALPDLDELVPGLLTPYTGITGSMRFKVGSSIVRHAFFIEPVVLPGVTTTRYRTRWTMSQDDPRYASPAECVDVAKKIILLLRQLVDMDDGLTMLGSFITRNMVAFELPIDYESRDLPIHRAENIELIDFELLREVAGLRLLLLDIANPQHKQFERIYRNKIAIKTYLTDRAQTGAHMTNREKRWEAHPSSVQFARRSTCLSIELVLVNLLCNFEGFPADIKELLEKSALLQPRRLQPTRCPVTLRPLSYEEFVAEVMAPVQGLSRFQVGHLNPLKLEGNTWSDGHSPANIGWLSSDGNRIQGSLSVDETRTMLVGIWAAYKDAGLLPAD